MGEIVQDYRGVRTFIEDSFDRGCKFARVLGFQRTEMVVSHFGRDYHVYEARE